VADRAAERRTARRARLDQPAEPRSRRPHYDPDAFGRLSERIARFLGTAKFLVYMTVFIALWVLVNVTPVAFDPYTFTFLTLLLSLQASYAAPLILLAQNRQTDRDRISMEEDRAQNARLMAEVEYLTRELASLRHALGEVPTRDFLREQLREVTEEVVARSGETASKVLYDRTSREKREERERRAERKRRVKQTRGEQDAPVGGLGEPFAGETAEL
jgi:uncharacterized membrane protein